MNYQEAITYMQGLTKFGINLGLSRMERLLAGLGNPHWNLTGIHVGGTNGKGSVCAMLSSILNAAGYRVGLFTSPHLESYTERFQIKGRAIAEAELARLISRLKPLLEQMVAEGYEHPTEFELSTAIAFQYFTEAGADLAVFEVGLGGNIDATNLFQPLLTVITNVSADHEAVLGNTLAEIARAKAGIIKPGIPLITAAEGAALDLIQREANYRDAEVVRVLSSPPARNSRTVLYRTVWLLKPQLDSAGPGPGDAAGPCDGQVVSLQGLHQEYSGLPVPLLGDHQGLNAGVAIAAIEILQEQGLAVTEGQLRQGLAAVDWPGRLEIVCRKPLILVDGAHNPAGARRLAEFLGRNFLDYRIILILGILEDKDRERIVREIAPLANAVIVTAPPSSRAGDWAAAAGFAEHYTDRVFLLESITEALLAGVELVREEAQSGKRALLCVTGSLYLVAEVRKRLRFQPGAEGLVNGE